MAHRLKLFVQVRQLVDAGGNDGSVGDHAVVQGLTRPFEAEAPQGGPHCVAGLSEDAPGRQGELVEAFAPAQVLGDLAGEEQGQLTGACVQDAPSLASGAISSATRMAP